MGEEAERAAGAVGVTSCVVLPLLLVLWKFVVAAVAVGDLLLVVRQGQHN